jgi:hypothetical protein
VVLKNFTWIDGLDLKAPGEKQWTPRGDTSSQNQPALVSWAGLLPFAYATEVTTNTSTARTTIVILALFFIDSLL